MQAMRQTFSHVLAALLLLASLTMASCIRVDYDDCPPMKIRVVVKDKNYFNVNKVDLEDARDEHLPFGNYVPNITYRLRDISTGKTVASLPLTDVSGTDEDYTFELPTDLPFGTYELTVWGGLSDDEPLSTDMEQLPLHPTGVEGGDPYLTRDTLTYDAYHAAHIVEMERVKGKLIVETWFLPRVAVVSTNKVDHLYTQVDAQFRYTGKTQLSREADWSAAEDYMVWKTVLPPSTGDKQSVLDIDFRDATGNIRTELLPKDVKITMNRNALTVLRYVWTWNPDTRREEWIIYILINDNWEVYHDMIID